MPSAAIAELGAIEAATAAATGAEYVPGNRVRILQNGDEIFPAMLQAMRTARQSIDLSTYVYWRSHIATEFADAMIERAAHGVRVRLLVDAFGGAIMDARTLARLEKSGVQLSWFHPIRWPHLHKFNNRAHRKILVVDDHVGFTGGVGIAAQWTGRADSQHHWRDTHCEVIGPAVAWLHEGFDENWHDGAHYEDQTPPVESLPDFAQGGLSLLTVVSNPESSGPTLASRLFLSAFEAATRSINITTAYFVPPDNVAAGLCAAARRGVTVKIITNGPRTNHRTTRQAGRASYARLLAAGVQIFEYQPTVMHTKTMTIDGHWSTLGSINLDARSFVLNDELNIAATGVALAATLDAAFATDLASSQLVDPSTWHQRGIMAKIHESIAKLFASQL